METLPFDLSLLSHSERKEVTMVKVKKILGDDIFGLWHVKQIIINNGGKRFSFARQ